MKNQRTGDALKHISHPSFIKRGLTDEQRKAGNIADLKAVQIDSRTTIFIKPDADEAQAVARWHKRNLECVKIKNGKPTLL